MEYSAFIYTRTYSEFTDYRLLVAPDDFTGQKTKWVLDYVREVKTAIYTQRAIPSENLLQRVFLSDQQHYVFGILCNLKRLLSEDERKNFATQYLPDTDEKAKYLAKYSTEEKRKGKQLTEDEKTRPIPYTFLAYVVKKSSNNDSLSSVRFELDIFKPLCEHICQKWLEETENTLRLAYDRQDLADKLLDSNANLDNLPNLNFNPENIQLYPAVEPYPRQLWAAASLSYKPQSLWIAQLPNVSEPESIIVSSVPRKSLLQGNFLNVVLPSVSSPKLFSKQSGLEISNDQVTITDQEKERLNLRNTMAQLQQKITNLENQVTEQEKERLNSINTIEQLQQKITNLESQVTKQETEQLNSINTIEQLQQKITNLESQVTEQEKERLNSTNTIEQLQQKITQLENRVEGLEKQHSHKTE